MASAIDVAKYILEKRGETETMKLQKLVYYSQAWNLVWADEPIFDEDIEAWINGPVVRELYALHRGEIKIDSEALDKGDSSVLTPRECKTIDKIVDFYGKHSSFYLSQLTHDEKPWQYAREGLSPDERGSKPISPADMKEYYESL
jgi:uncharacterized phage-associated protein